MTSFFESDLRKSLLALAVAGALTACGGDDSGDNIDPEIEEEEHEHAGSRLIYTVTDESGVFLFEEAESEFSKTDVTTSTTGATLVLATSKMTAALLDNGAVSIVDAGIEHHEEEGAEEAAAEEEHSEEEHEDVTATATVLTSITQIVATHEYFSAFDGMDSHVIDAETGSEITAPSSDAYPILALSGGHFLTFNAAETGINVTVTEEDGTALTTPAAWNCDGNIAATAQTEILTQVLCSNGNLLTLVAEEGATDTTFNSESAADTDFTALTPATSGDDVIAAWSTSGELTLTLGMGDHTHTVDVSDNVTSTNFIGVATLAEEGSNVFGVLGTDGVFTGVYYAIEGHAITYASKDAFVIDADATWESDDALYASDISFFAFNSSDNRLYLIDGHEDGDLHVHTSISDSALSNVASAVFAFAGEGGDEHAHEESEHEEEGHAHEEGEEEGAGTEAVQAY